jgi:hypothetical protein
MFISIYANINVYVYDKVTAVFNRRKYYTNSKEFKDIGICMYVYMYGCICIGCRNI